MRLTTLVPITLKKMAYSLLSQELNVLSSVQTLSTQPYLDIWAAVARCGILYIV